MPLPFKKPQDAKSARVAMLSERVKDLANKGFSEMEIIAMLRREGYMPEEIDYAITTMLKSSVSVGRKPPETKIPTLEELIPKTAGEVPESSLPSEYYDYPLDEYVDALVQARVSEIDSKINQFSFKYEELEKKINNLGDQLNEIIKQRSEEQKQIIQKLETFGELVNEITGRLANLEKAFKEALPALIESVRALSDVVRKLKAVEQA